MDTLRGRLNLAFVLPTALIVVALVAVAYMTARQGLEDELGRRLEAVAQVMAADLSEGIDAAQISRLDASMGRVRQRLRQRLTKGRDATEVSRVVIFDRQSQSLVDTDDSSFGQTLYRIESDRREIGAVFDRGEARSGTLFRDDDGLFHKRAYAPITQDGEVVAAVGVVASATFFDALRQFALLLFLLGAVGVVVVVAMGVWMARILSRPVDHLVEAAGRLEEGDLDTPLTAPQIGRRAPKELAYLMTSFEQMRAGLVERDQRMRMMLAGIAHEVRNPLGGMELFCGLLKEDLAAMDAGEASIGKVARIEREIDYLEDLVRDFMEFARPTPPQLARFSAADLVAEVAEISAADREQAGCELSIDVVPNLELCADWERLRRAMINVVRNACQAQTGQAGGHIEIRVTADDGGRTIEIIDNGPGIAPEDLAELCKPFYTTRQQGSGLGLALTRQILDDHDAEMTIDSTVGGGTTVRFWLPFDEALPRRAADDDGQEETTIPEGWLG